MKTLLYRIFGMCLTLFVAGFLYAQEQSFSRIVVEGNKTVQNEAILQSFALDKGKSTSPPEIAKAIKRLHATGYFSRIQVDKAEQGGKSVLIVKVEEKDTIHEITYQNFSEVTPDDHKEKLKTKPHTILNESILSQDAKTLEIEYLKQGYYLARVTWEAVPIREGEVKIVFSVIENSPLKVGRVFLNGNWYFSDDDLKSKLRSQEESWMTWMTSGGNYQDESVRMDKQILGFLYSDNGFAQNRVKEPKVIFNAQLNEVDVFYSIEEGDQFHVKEVELEGDILGSEQELRDELELVSEDLFRSSKLQKDMMTLKTIYGDKGYAFADIRYEIKTHPKPENEEEKRYLSIKWKIAKGKMAYFRNINIVGNSKTRDNVIRRKLKVHEGERFHATRLRKSDSGIKSTGYFEKVAIKQIPDQKTGDIDLLIEVEEKRTGTLQATFGGSPGSDGGINLFVKGSYSENNLLGKGWRAKFNIDLSTTYTEFSTGLFEPSIDDGPWSVGFDASYKLKDSVFGDSDSDETKDPEQSYEIGFRVGRAFWENFRFSLGYNFKQVVAPSAHPKAEVGTTEEFIQVLSYTDLNNSMTPTDGFEARFKNTYAFNGLWGENEFGRFSIRLTKYIPLKFSDAYISNFRLTFQPAWLYPVSDQPIPEWEYFELGSRFEMRAYGKEGRYIGQKCAFQGLSNVFPGENFPTTATCGGVQRIYAAAEYFFPIVPEANLRLVTFFEAGAVTAAQEDLKSDSFKYDVGMGFRWVTPVAPFRFEWAWPIEDGSLGDMSFIFNIGFDNVSFLD